MELRLAGLPVALALALACESRGAPEGTSPSANPTPALSSSPASPSLPPTPGKPITFSSEDGAALAGDLYLADDATAPSAVLVHRQSGDRAELAPLVEKLTHATKRYHVLAFDLRGSGASKAPKDAKPDDTTKLSKDVEAAIAQVIDASHGQTRGVVLVGTSLGAALACEVAFAEPKVTALALISPGAAISGHDVFRPYAEVRNLPTFLAGAKDDNVAASALGSLEKMALAGTVKRYDGSRHSAGFLGAEHPELWSDLEDFMLQVFDSPIVERKSLYYAPGKEPKSHGPSEASGKPKGGR